MKTKNIIQKVQIKATPLEVFNALMDSKKHSEFTCSECQICSKVGSAYSAYDGYIYGKTIELINGKKIVQTWQPIDGVWPEGYFSEIVFELSSTPTGTLLNFIHKGVPENQYEEFKKGWKDNYWVPLKAYFKKHK